MKSGKQRRLEIKQKRREKARQNKGIDVYSAQTKLPRHAVKANHVALLHNSAYWRELPLFYIDREFVCRDCGSHEIWTAKQQKWWYETVKAYLESRAVRCRRCRKKIREQKLEQKKHMEEMAQREPHPNEAFFKKRYMK